LEYDKALLYDKRTCVQYYLSLLRINHLFVFSFYCQSRDYNSQIIKILLFFLFFSLHFTINALFFNDKTMHKIYLDEGDYDFIYQVPQIIYSSLISSIISLIIKFLALSEKNILDLKKENEDDKNNLDIKSKKLFGALKIKFILFFIFSFILLITILYYITCFCGVYTNTQVHLIKDTLVSFGLSLIYPFGIYIIPCIFRIPALNAKIEIKLAYINYLNFYKTCKIINLFHS